MAQPETENVVGNIHKSAEAIGHHLRIMEVCGTHTHAIGRGGLRALLPPNVELVSGPGCPVCVTSQRDVELMLLLAKNPEVIITTFGDMLRVPGLSSSLEKERSEGADVRVVYSALDALKLARSEPGREVVFLAVGFETTAPGIAAVVQRAYEEKISNFSIFTCHKLIVPAMEAVVQGESMIDGFLTPGHVSVIIGAEAYEDFVKRYGFPCVATGFEPADVLTGIAMLLECLQEKRIGSFVQYTRAVKPGGNTRAWDILMAAFDISEGDWRGLGEIAESGLKLKSYLKDFDAATRFSLPHMDPVHLPGCRCGDVLKGLIHPPECPHFGKKCTPRNPLGPCMVSSEGSCAARYKYG
jgi:hydrogenase expression/formation protein HypD